MGKKNKVNIIDTDNIHNLANYNITDQNAQYVPHLNNTDLDKKLQHDLDSVCTVSQDVIAALEDDLFDDNVDDIVSTPSIHNEFKLKNKDKEDKPSTDIIKELLTNQLKNVNLTKRLNYNDIKRISKFLTSSIFDPLKCSLWTGYITNEKNQSKGTYINFYFNQKKIALHRLLYLNFIGEIINTEYLKFSCPNKGKCCNINHLKKYSYNSLIPNHPTSKPNLVDNTVHINRDKESLSLEL